MSYGGVPYAGGAYASQSKAAGAAGAFPFVSLEWSPTTGPRATPVWEQVPLEDIRSIDITRGRNRELDRYQAGRMTVVLDNRDRTYDPQVDTNVKPMRRIRLRATYGGVSYDLFSGYVDSWDQDYEMTQEATCTVTATDGFKVLERAELPSSVYANEIIEDAPVLFYRLNESTFSDRVDPSVGSISLDIAGVPTFGQTSMVFGESGTAVQLPGDGDNTISTQVSTVPLTGPPISLEIIFKRTASGTDGNLIGQHLPGNKGTFYITVNSAGTVILLGINGAGTSNIATSTGVSIDDLNEHHIVGIWKASGAFKIYVDGVDRTSGTPSLAPTAFTAQTGYLWVGGTPPGLVEFGDAGTYQMAAFYNRELTAEEITAHSNARLAPWNGDGTGQRIGRLLDLLEWPASEREVDTGESTLQSATLDTSALDHANLVRDTEYGELFMLANGSVRFIDRHNRWLPPYNDPRFTLSDDGADLAYGRLKFNYDDQLIRNRVSVGYVNGLTHTANSTGSQDSFFIQSHSVSGLIGDVDTEGVDYANYILNQYDEPLLRVQGITITPQRDPDVYFPKVLAADLVYQVNVERTPQGTGSPIDIDYTIEGISHRIEPKFWRTDFQLSPADTPGAFILNSTSQGILDTNALGW